MVSAYSGIKEWRGREFDGENLKTIKMHKGNEKNNESLKNLIDTNNQRDSYSVQEIFEKRIQSEWLTTKEAAQFLGVSENALRIMVYRGQISVFKFGRRLRFRLKDCEALFVKKGA